MFYECQNKTTYAGKGNITSFNVRKLGHNKYMPDKVIQKNLTPSEKALFPDFSRIPQQCACCRATYISCKWPSNLIPMSEKGHFLVFFIGYSTLSNFHRQAWALFNPLKRANENSKQFL